MKCFSSVLAVLLASAASLVGQVTVEVVLDQEEFLRDESLPVKVRITNRSGQTLQFGKESDWLRFAIGSRDGRVIAKLADPPVPGEFTLESSTMGTRQVELMPYFDLSQPGRYSLTATVKIPQWKEEIVSAERSFHIARGTKIWEQEFGVPDSGQPPEVRKYALQQAPSLKEPKLYLRVTDRSENRVFRVLALGRLLSFSRPEAQVDRLSQLHVLFQNGARSFLYTVVNPNGEVIARQTHAYARTRPALRSLEDGRIAVQGGVRHMAPDDLPRPRSATATNDVEVRRP
jgi:hypothetical protein